MNVASLCGSRNLSRQKHSTLLILSFAACLLTTAGDAQQPALTANTAASDDTDAPALTISQTTTPEDRSNQAWALLTDAAGDARHPQIRIQALAALGLLRAPRASKLIAGAMADADLDVRTAAALAAAQTGDPNLTTPLRNLLDDKEPQVAFAAAMSLWKMHDKSGEDVLMAIVNGDRSASPGLIHGTEHKIRTDLHDPSMLARIGATEGASMLLGPFGFGVTAFEYIRKNGGNPSRVSAIEQIAQEKTAPVHNELLAALGDKDPAVRAAAAKALAGYRDKPTSMAIYALFADTKYPVRLTSAAAYLRTTGTPGPLAAASTPAAKAKR